MRSGAIPAAEAQNCVRLDESELIQRGRDGRAQENLRMSALPLLEPTVRPQPQTRPAPRPRPTPRKRRVARPVVRRRPLAASKVRALEKLTERALLFCGVAIATFMVSSLVGHVMVEQSRREGLAALTRLREASKAENLLQERVSALSNVEAVEAWALQHGFRAPEDAIASKPETTHAASH